MSSTTPLTDAINALTTYANEVTGKSDETLSDAVESLVNGYGGGGGDSVWNKILDGTATEVVDSDGIVGSLRNYVFFECKTLSLVNFPLVTNIGESSFYNCTGLTSINFPSATIIKGSAFSGCSKLVSANFPSASSVASYAFSYCSDLTSINFPLITSVNVYVFNGCAKLVSADFPRVSSIGGYALAYCKALVSLILRKADAVCTLAAKSSLASTPIASGTGYIYVPQALIETYKTANVWSNYANQFRALEDYTVDGTITGELDPNKI